jgi:hypothetical protein
MAMAARKASGTAFPLLAVLRTRSSKIGQVRSAGETTTAAGEERRTAPKARATSGGVGSTKIRGWVVHEAGQYLIADPDRLIADAGRLEPGPIIGMAG